MATLPRLQTLAKREDFLQNAGMSQTRSAPGPQQAPATWDAVAPTYAQDVAQWTAYAEEALRLVPAKASDRVLDVACGPGTATFVAAARASRVDAVDFSSGMIDELRARAARDGVTNIEAAVMDAQSLAFPDATFDLAFCLFAFFFFPDRARAFQEMRRVLRPGGRAVVVTWGPIERRPVMKLVFEAVAEALPDLPRPAKGDLQQPAECVREMTDAGFRDVEAHVFSASMHFARAEQYLETMLRSGAPFAVLKKKLGEEAWKAATARMLEALVGRFPAGGADLGAEAIFTLGTR